MLVNGICGFLGALPSLTRKDRMTPEKSATKLLANSPHHRPLNGPF